MDVIFCGTVTVAKIGSAYRTDAWKEEWFAGTARQLHLFQRHLFNAFLIVMKCFFLAFPGFPMPPYESNTLTLSLNQSNWYAVVCLYVCAKELWWCHTWSAPTEPIWVRPIHQMCYGIHIGSERMYECNCVSSFVYEKLYLNAERCMCNEPHYISYKASSNRIYWFMLQKNHFPGSQFRAGIYHRIPFW